MGFGALGRLEMVSSGRFLYMATEYLLDFHFYIRLLPIPGTATPETGNYCASLRMSGFAGNNHRSATATYSIRRAYPDWFLYAIDDSVRQYF